MTTDRSPYSKSGKPAYELSPDVASHDSGPPGTAGHVAIELAIHNGGRASRTLVPPYRSDDAAHRRCRSTKPQACGGDSPHAGVSCQPWGLDHGSGACTCREPTGTVQPGRRRGGLSRRRPCPRGASTSRGLQPDTVAQHSGPPSGTGRMPAKSGKEPGVATVSCGKRGLRGHRGNQPPGRRELGRGTGRFADECVSS